MDHPLTSVLIVDDEPQFMAYYQENLEENGVRVQLISDPVKAFEEVSLRSDKYDLFVIDLMMSGLVSATETLASPPQSYIEGGLAMGRWIMDGIPPSSAVLALTNRNTSKIHWAEKYFKKFDRFALVDKSDCPAYEFVDFLRGFLEDPSAASID